MVVGNNESTTTKNAGKSLAISIATRMHGVAVGWPRRICVIAPIALVGHGDAAVQRGAHRPIEHFRGFTRIHWMQPSGECLRRIALVAAMVDEFVETTENTNKKLFLAN